MNSRQAAYLRPSFDILTSDLRCKSCGKAFRHPQTKDQFVYLFDHGIKNCSSIKQEKDDVQNS